MPDEKIIQGIDNSSDFLAAHEDVVKRVLEKQPIDEHLYDLAELFKVFGDSTRIKILYALLESELCVGDMAQLFNVSPSAISHQLKILKDAKLVRYRREGKIIFYTLDDEHVRNILSMGMEHVEE
ncbi:MAG: ArsR/SmtB family transcription factor [Acutalibacteraceae bacterium]